MNEEQEPVENSSTRLSPPNAASDRLCELDPANNETVGSTGNQSIVLPCNQGTRRLISGLTYILSSCASTTYSKSTGGGPVISLHKRLCGHLAGWLLGFLGERTHASNRFILKLMRRVGSVRCETGCSRIAYSVRIGPSQPKFLLFNHFRKPCNRPNL
jgi:hypothetical protein